MSTNKRKKKRGNVQTRVYMGVSVTEDQNLLIVYITEMEKASTSSLSILNAARRGATSSRGGDGRYVLTAAPFPSAIAGTDGGGDEEAAPAMPNRSDKCCGTAFLIFATSARNAANCRCSRRVSSSRP